MIWSVKGSKYEDKFNRRMLAKLLKRDTPQTIH